MPPRSRFDDASLDRLLLAARNAPEPRAHSLKEIAVAAGVSDARIRQIVQKALTKIRRNAVSNALRREFR
jgi:DNA-directed RNA polymerase sigma subunit (sigma70/sigma32)